MAELSSGLSLEQLKELALTLEGTNTNVFNAVRNEFGIQAKDTIFSDLEKQCSLFKCIECSRWTHTDHRSEQTEHTCTECTEE